MQSSCLAAGDIEDTQEGALVLAGHIMPDFYSKTKEDDQSLKSKTIVDRNFA